MTLYTFPELEGLWEQAGGRKRLAPVMAAIAIAESHPPGDVTHADSNAVNPHDNGGKQTSWGLWQISDGTHNRPVKDILDPLANAQQAVSKLHSQGLGAWGTYTSGAYKHFLHSAPAVQPTGTGQAPGTTTAAGRGSGGDTVNPNVGKGLSGSNKPSGGLSGWFHSVWLGLGAGLGVSAGSGNEPAQAIIGTVHAPSDLGSVADAIAGLTLPFVVMARALDWFFVPSHWVRIIAGIGGGFLAIGGVYQLTQSSQDKPAKLPLGIAMTGAGGVLLFVAFHNIDPSIKTLGEFLADLQGKAQTGLSATVSPKAAVSAAGG